MKGSLLTKLIRVGSYLLTHPNEIGKYTKLSINSLNTPVQLELPWIAFKAIDVLDDFVERHHQVAEFGGGGSTIYFSKRAKSVLCIESSYEWTDVIQKKLNDLNISNVTIEVFPFDALDEKGYIDSQYNNRISDEKYDIILVDGYEESVKLRTHCFWKAEESINEGGIIIVDDSWRYPEIRNKNNSKKNIICKSIGPCRPGVTTTDIFYY